MPIAPNPSGSALQHAIRLYRASIGRCWPLSLIGAGWLAGAGLYWTAHTPTVALEELGFDAAADMHMLLANYLSPAALRADGLIGVLALLFDGALIAQMHALAVSGEHSTGWQAFAAALRRLPGTIVACVSWIVVTGICLVVLLIPGNHVGLALLLLFPSIYLSGRLQLWWPAMFVENLGGIAALRRSWAVTRSQWWRSAGALTWALIVIGLLELFADAIVAAAAAASPGAAQLLGLLANALLMPTLPAALLATYYQTARQADKKNPAERGLNLST